MRQVNGSITNFSAQNHPWLYVDKQSGFELWNEWMEKVNRCVIDIGLISQDSLNQSKFIQETLHQLQYQSLSPAYVIAAIQTLKIRLKENNQAAQYFPLLDGIIAKTYERLKISKKNSLAEKRKSNTERFEYDVLGMLWARYQNEIDDGQLMFGLSIYKDVISRKVYEPTITLIKTFIEKDLKHYYQNPTEVPEALLYETISNIRKIFHFEAADKTAEENTWDYLIEASDYYQEIIYGKRKLQKEIISTEQENQQTKKLVSGSSSLGPLLFGIMFGKQILEAAGQETVTNYLAMTNSTSSAFLTNGALLNANQNETTVFGKVELTAGNWVGIIQTIETLTGKIVANKTRLFNDGTSNNLEEIFLSAIIPGTEDKIFVGEVTTPLSSTKELLAFRLNSDFTIAWIKIIGGSAPADTPATLHMKSDGSFFIGGETRATDVNGNGYILNMDSDGTILWGRQLTGAGLGAIKSIIPKPNASSYLLAGVHTNSTQQQGVICEFTNSGTVSNCRLGAASSNMTIMDLTPEGDYVVGVATLNALTNDVVVFRYDVSTPTTLTFAKRIDFAGQDQAIKTVALNNGDQIVLAKVNGTSAIVQMDNTGEIIFAKKFENGLEGKDFFTFGDQIGIVGDLDIGGKKQSAFAVVYLKNTTLCDLLNPAYYSIEDFSLSFSSFSMSTSTWTPSSSAVGIGASNPGVFGFFEQCKTDVLKIISTTGTTGVETTGAETTETTDEGSTTGFSITTGLIATTTLAVITTLFSDNPDDKGEKNNVGLGVGLAFLFMFLLSALLAGAWVYRKHHKRNSDRQDIEMHPEGRRRGYTEGKNVESSRLVKNRDTITDGKTTFDIVDEIFKEEARQLFKQSGKIILVPSIILNDGQSATTVLGKLGEGHFGSIGIAKNEDNFSAFKLQPKTEFTDQEQAIQNELSQEKPEWFIRKLFSTKIISRSTAQEQSVIVMPIAPFGNGSVLKALINNHATLDQKFEILTDFSLTILQALIYMHNKNICHNDLHPKNILIDKNFNFKISDFGTSTRSPDKKVLFSTNGKIDYYSAERLAVTEKGKGSFDGENNDLFGFAISLFEFIHGSYTNFKEYERLYPENSNEHFLLTLIGKVFNGEIQKPSQAFGFLKKHLMDPLDKISKQKQMTFKKILGNYYKDQFLKIDWIKNSDLRLQNVFLNALTGSDDLVIDSALQQIINSDYVQNKLYGFDENQKNSMIVQFYTQLNEILKFDYKFIKVSKSLEVSLDSSYQQTIQNANQSTLWSNGQKRNTGFYLETQQPIVNGVDSSSKKFGTSGE